MAPANRAIYRNEVLVQRAGLLRTMQYSNSSFLLCKQRIMTTGQPVWTSPSSWTERTNTTAFDTPSLAGRMSRLSSNNIFQAKQTKSIDPGCG